MSEEEIFSAKCGRLATAYGATSAGIAGDFLGDGTAAKVRDWREADRSKYERGGFCRVGKQ